MDWVQINLHPIHALKIFYVNFLKLGTVLEHKPVLFINERETEQKRKKHVLFYCEIYKSLRGEAS
ncbi:hypothetical protein CW304_17895 [Bacillus sp. UFRGS-B20]|nr:hypothetical protein CW304_17895 [Bacillus sp. UFRGS-B20]